MHTALAARGSSEARLQGQKIRRAEIQRHAMRKYTRKRRTREHVIADLSVNHLERVVLRAGHTVERFRHDYGFD